MKEHILNIASYIAQRYHEMFGANVDEMKLHKLLYFAQRESFVRYDRPMFSETLVAGQYGPMSISVREAFKAGALTGHVSDAFIEVNRDALGYVFYHFAPMNSWSLSNISHGESSWQKARTGIDRYSQEYREMSVEDIRRDAARNKTRRIMLQNVFPKRYANAPYCL